VIHRFVAISQEGLVDSNGISNNPENPILNNRPAAQTDYGSSSSHACPTCGAGNGFSRELPSPSYVYAVGRIEPRFPRISVEKELAQVVARDDTTGLTDRRVLQSILARPENRYLARQMCWVFSVGGLETYILIPSDPHDASLLIDALRPSSSGEHLDVVIGRKGPFAPADMCNGLMIPLVAFDQIYSFDRESLINSIPRPENSSEDFKEAARDLLDRILLMTDRMTDVTDKYFVRVDVSDEFPFLVSKLMPYYDR
jgi:hypothetical protein